MAATSLGRFLKQGRESAIARPLVPPTSRRWAALHSVDEEINVAFYSRAWSTRLERNGALNYPQSAATAAHDDPIAIIAVRKDGSVEDVVIERSSGLPELDAAVRRIVLAGAPYATFPPSVASSYDVLELRKVFIFGTTLRVIDAQR